MARDIETNPEAPKFKVNKLVKRNTFYRLCFEN